MYFIEYLITFMCIAIFIIICIGIAHLFRVIYKRSKEAHEKALLNPKPHEQQLIELLQNIALICSGILIMSLLRLG